MTSLVAGLGQPLTALWLAVPPGDSDPASGKGPEWGEAAPIGLLVWLLLGLALFLLIKSLNRHLRRVPASFDKPADTGDPSAEQAAEGSAVGGQDSADLPAGDGGPGGDGYLGDGDVGDGDAGDAEIGDSGAGGRRARVGMTAEPVAGDGHPGRAPRSGD